MPWATVFKNVWLPFRLKGRSKAETRDEIMEALEMVGLESFANSYPRELSGGMKMRVSIARALVTPAEAAPDGRAVCSPRRDLSIPAQ